MRCPVLAALGLLLAGPAFGFAIEVPRPHLCARASLVVVGEVTGGEARWTPDGAIETVHHVSIARVVRGAPPPDALLVTTPGGRIGEVGLTIDHAATLAPDRRYLLLLAASGDGWRVVGEQQGAIALRHGGDDDAAAIASLGDCRAP